MRKKINWLVLTFSVLLSCSFASNEQTHNDNNKTTISEIQIYLVDLDLENIFKVNCESFKKTFSKEIKQTKITDRKTIQEFARILKSLKKDTEKYSPDVRGQIIIKYSNGSIDTLCVSRFGFELNGVSLKYDSKLIKVITRT